jgi:hypothetical protein
LITAALYPVYDDNYASSAVRAREARRLHMSLLWAEAA